ncbi:hypothetical protein B0H13DRAFT_2300044 [Mycena leptocephala]|nr:hypothetical protein B0H13DRAFT_2300044 [Mycena leptocephala]
MASVVTVTSAPAPSPQSGAYNPTHPPRRGFRSLCDTPRAVSRSVDSASSKALIDRGVEVVAANLFDKESVKEAIQGIEAVFGVCMAFLYTSYALMADSNEQSEKSSVVVVPAGPTLIISPHKSQLTSWVFISSS